MSKLTTSPKSYLIGFLLSLCLTLAAYLMVSRHTSSNGVLVFGVVCLALVQLFVQLKFFLHLGSESKPKWNLLVFGFMLGVLLILVFGSLWIMYNLNYHHGGYPVSPANPDAYTKQDEGIKL